MARPKNSGEGSVKQRANGRWLARVWIDGKRFNRTVGSKAEGNRWLREMKAKADQGLLAADAHNLTFGAYLDHWLEAIAGSVGHKTWEGYEWAVRCHLKPGLGRYKLADLKALHLGTLYAGKVKQSDPKTGKPLAATSVNLIHRTARAALNQAVEWNYLVQSPTQGAPVPRVPRRERTVWDKDQVVRFLASIEGHRLEPAFRVMLATGLRPAELLALRQDDLDPATGMLRVQRKVVRLKNGRGLEIGEPKTHQERSIKLGRSVVAALHAWQVTRSGLRDKAGPRWQEQGWLFPSTIGTTLEPRNFNRSFFALLKEQQLPRIRLYDLRHTCATVLLNAGVPAKVIQEMLGHSSIKVTMDVYAAVLPLMQDAAAEAMDAILVSGRDPARDGGEDGVC